MKAWVIALMLFAALPTAEADSGARTSASNDSVDCARRNSARRTRGRRRRSNRVAKSVLFSLEQPRFKVAPDGSSIPEIRAQAGIVYDPSTGERLWGERADEARPIASISKVMSILVAFEHDRDPNELIVIDRTDTTQASKTRLRPRAEVRYEDLLRLAVIASDNAAVRAIARTSPGGTASFVARMNARAHELGLSSMRFMEPTGLDHHNVGSPADLARLISVAARDERITSLMLTPESTVKVGRRTVTYRNTDRLLGRSDIRVFAGKTGYIDEAGHCFASLVADPVDGRTKAVVVLGATVRPAVFAETRHLLRWATASAKGDSAAPEPAINEEPQLPSIELVVAAVEAKQAEESGSVPSAPEVVTHADEEASPQPHGLDVMGARDPKGCTPARF
ncbi:MAG: D-alanyl-D-alanine carboxypeptidase [Deltaproteobacteria bacterium]|nr:D-alanyl-D-alanine carboxypeptidase [Deltaproteobacteria bacterium]